MPYWLDPELFPEEVREQVFQDIQRIGKELYEKYEVFENTSDDYELGIPDDLWEKLYKEAEEAAIELIVRYGLDPFVALDLTWAIHDVAVDAP